MFVLTFYFFYYIFHSRFFHSILIETITMSATVVIMRGKPGAGKSRYVKEVFPGAFVCCPDDFFMKDGVFCYDPTRLQDAHSHNFRKFLSVLLAGRDLVVCDATNTSLWEVSPYRLAALSYGYRVRIIRIECDDETAFRRNIHGVPRQYYDRIRIQNCPAYWKEEIIG